MITLTINGESHTVDVDPTTPLLWVIRDYVGLMGTNETISGGLFQKRLSMPGRVEIKRIHVKAVALAHQHIHPHHIKRHILLEAANAPPTVAHRNRNLVRFDVGFDRRDRSRSRRKRRRSKIVLPLRRRGPGGLRICLRCFDSTRHRSNRRLTIGPILFYFSCLFFPSPRGRGAGGEGFPKPNRIPDRNPQTLLSRRHLQSIFVGIHPSRKLHSKTLNPLRHQLSS